MNLTLGPVYMEKSCPGQEGHSSSRVNFTERLYEKKIVPFARVKSWLSNNSRAGACSDPLASTELTRVGEPKCLYARCKLLTTVKIFWFLVNICACIAYIIFNQLYHFVQTLFLWSAPVSLVYRRQIFQVSMIKRLEHFNWLPTTIMKINTHRNKITESASLKFWFGRVKFSIYNILDLMLARPTLT